MSSPAFSESSVALKLTAQMSAAAQNREWKGLPHLWCNIVAAAHNGRQPQARLPAAIQTTRHYSTYLSGQFQVLCKGQPLDSRHHKWTDALGS